MPALFYIKNHETGAGFSAWEGFNDSILVFPLDKKGIEKAISMSNHAKLDNLDFPEIATCGFPIEKEKVTEMAKSVLISGSDIQELVLDYEAEYADGLYDEDNDAVDWWLEAENLGMS